MPLALTASRNVFCGLLALLSIAALTVPAAAEPAYGFAVGDTLPIYTFHGEDGVRRSTAEFRGKWFLFKRGAEWCMPCTGERPSVESFMKAHPDVPVVMLVSPRPSETDLEEAFQRDLNYQRRKGLRLDYIAALDSRDPLPRDLPAPKSVSDLPLTVVVDPQGVIAALWTSTYQYQRQFMRHGIVGKAEPEFRDYVEALLSCKGAKGVAATSTALEVAKTFDASCS
nr:MULTISPECIES: redoxin domain-containing protein [Azospirillum]